MAVPRDLARHFYSLETRQTGFWPFAAIVALDRRRSWSWFSSTAIFSTISQIPVMKRAYPISHSYQLRSTTWCIFFFLLLWRYLNSLFIIGINKQYVALNNPINGVFSLEDSFDFFMKRNSGETIVNERKKKTEVFFF